MQKLKTLKATPFLEIKTVAAFNKLRDCRGAPSRKTAPEPAQAHASGLLTDAELFLGDDGAVAVDVFAHQVVEKTTALTYEHLQSALCCMILMI